ncbi:hypothetical protein [Marinovum sp.]|uniref:hypothetical protein n=1 Tax=Marinovum sp. TaxID=2024839 RepID=UPI002B26FE1B|nr:hypothetical protein [Marinovum sp.]
MSDLKDAILDAKYIDMVSLADFVVQDCGLPDYDDDGNPLPQQNEVAAAIFRWAARHGAAPDAGAESNSRPGAGAPPANDAGEGDD